MKYNLKNKITGQTLKTQDFNLSEEGVQGALLGVRAGYILAAIGGAKLTKAIWHSDMKKGWKVLGAMITGGETVTAAVYAAASWVLQIEKAEEPEAEAESEENVPDEPMDEATTES